MSKTKFVLGMSMVVALFAFTATPALARWTNHKGKGAAKSGEGTLTYEGASVKCASATGSYKVNSEGTALVLEEIVWKECKGLGLKAEVTCASLELKQPEKEGTKTGKATGAQISTTCTVVIPGACTITITTTGNTNLLGITLTVSGSNVNVNVAVVNITATATGSGCALGGISKEKTTTATEKVPGLVAEGVSLE